jgi:hypothetical protein
MHAKCPKCDSQLTRCDMDQIVIGNQLSGPFLHGVVAMCPHLQCRAVLGVFADPASLAADVADLVKKTLGKIR